MVKPIEELADLFADMPGVGPRQARRLVQFLLKADSSYTAKLAEKIASIRSRVRQCPECMRFSEFKTVSCAWCADHNRDDGLLMVVEKDVDAEGIENAGMFKGHYFVLGSLLPLTEGRRASRTIRLPELLKKITKDQNLKEVVLAFATTAEGDYTASELRKVLSEKRPGLTISMLGRGLSLGAEIEYADQETLRNAFLARQ